jgi:hypothetical protein
MSSFIVNPPIHDDQDYYRDDDDIVAAILGGQSTLAVGLRRSGKTSFLLRVERAARRNNRDAVCLDVWDPADDDLADRLASVGKMAANAPHTLLLLDEAERWRSWPEAAVKELFRVTRPATLVITCAPQFMLELDQEPEFVHRRLEGFYRHVIGPLSEDEARNLLARRRRDPPPRLDDTTVERLLAQGDRLPIILQALGAQAADGIDLATSLAGFGQRVLSGLTDAARDLFIIAAHGGEIEPDLPEAQLLITLGALSRAQSVPRIGSPLLAELVTRVSARPPRASPETLPPPPWQLHARILHLSDLHFGRSIDPARIQAERLIAALERDHRIPHFVAITGDLSWTGSPMELRQCEEFVEAIAAWLRDRLGLTEPESRRRVMMVPGNHEASWNLSRGVAEADHDQWLSYSLAPFANFANRFYRGAVVWDLDDPCMGFDFADPAVSFLALSTAHFITEQKSMGKFGPQVRTRALGLLSRPAAAASRFRIGLWHHNMRAFQEDGHHIVDVDVAALDFVRSRPSLDLALHGHVHQGEVDVYPPRGGHPPLPYSAVGSFGVTADHRPGDGKHGVTPNELALVELETSGTGRRSITRYYELELDPNGRWAWQDRRSTPPRLL